jgi:hypothetical protein
MREQTGQKHFGPKPLAAIVRYIQISGKVVSFQAYSGPQYVMMLHNLHDQSMISVHDRSIQEWKRPSQNQTLTTALFSGCVTNKGDHDKPNRLLSDMDVTPGANCSAMRRQRRVTLRRAR